MDLMINQKKGSQQGQIALVVVLVMLVVATIGLSVASRTLTDVHLSAQEEEKIRAFSAAEAGLEAVLKQGLTGGGGSVNLGDFTYNYNVSAVNTGGSPYELSEPLENGATTQINLEGSTNLTSLTIYWINTAASSDEILPKKAALEISIYKQDGAVSRVAVNPYGEDNGYDFKSGSSVTAGEMTGFTRTYHSKYSLPNTDISLNPATDKFIRIKALYNKTSIGIRPNGGATLAPQAYKAKVTSTQGESTAAVEVVQSAAAVPGIFDYALWSGTGISK